MLLYAVRHGQSQTNSLGLFPPVEGNPLTEKGFADAQKAGRVLEGIAFDRIVSSDLLRAVQTAKTAVPGCTPELDLRLREADYGTLALKSIAECDRTMGDAFLELRKARDYRPFGGESTSQQISRLRSFMDDMSKMDEDAKVAAFCHEGSIKSMLCVALDADIPFRNIKVGNGSVSVFEFSKGRWHLVKWGMEQ